MKDKRIYVAIGALALISALAACGSSGSVYSAAYAAGASYATNTILQGVAPDGSVSVAEASQTCSQAYVNGDNPGDGITPPPQYAPGTDACGNWTQGWSDGCVHALTGS